MNINLRYSPKLNLSFLPLMHYTIYRDANVLYMEVKNFNICQCDQLFIS